ncbi:MAG: Lipoate-protein ligase A [Eubacteriales bacterium SKADARSKE-1]|nr:Lipoate-protein ligase A [Eubacteriales bacterium SKADARSKE-1]
MIRSLKYIISKNTVPYYNLALEEYLLFSTEPDEMVFYLWQNKNTVVIGRNQNPYRECKISDIKKDGSHIVRRLSGGGAVYHDSGNLNFTFLVRHENNDVNKQLSVILKALQLLGINAQASGRNDITVDGKKFSGNAFYRSKDYCYHHGTLLIDVDIENLSKYLNVSASKLKSKGVSSVKSRVANLKDYKKDLTIETVKDALLSAVSEVYDLAPQRILDEELDKNKIRELENKFSSNYFIYPNKFNYQIEMQERFPWGEIQLLFNLKDNIIESVRAYSDALDEQFILYIPEVMKDCLFSETSLIDAIDKIPLKNELSHQIATDIKELIIKNLNES